MHLLLRGSDEVGSTSGYSPAERRGVQVDSHWPLTPLQTLQLETFGVSVRSGAREALCRQVVTRLSAQTPPLQLQPADTLPEPVMWSLLGLC